jgi:hypothetical protein
MKTSVGFTTFCGRLCLVVLCLFLLGSRPALAFDDPPTRVARLNYMSGEVSFQPGGETDWAWATLNRPMTSGDSLWTGDQARAEMHIGSTAIRVGAQTSVSFLNLDDRTVQLQLNSGTINLRVRNLFADNVFEVDTPNLAFTLLRRGDYRITVDPNGSFTTITLRDGQGQINGGGQAFLVDGGSQVQVSGTDYISYDIYDLPRKDSFDQWSYTRQLREDRSRSARYVSPELTGSEDLDQNGTWRTDRELGPVWVPTHVSRDWAPYRDGHWAWVDPWGWTWVDDAPSGFVTSHYGRWAHVNGGYGGGGWVWVPPHREARRDASAERPVYSPALVTFVGDSNSSRDFGNRGGVAWFPLAPGEVYVPAYQTSPKYVTNVNITNTVVQQTTITNVTNNVTNNNTTIYVNQKVAGAVTAVPRDTFVNARPVAQAAVKVAPNAIIAGPVVRTAPVAPERASIMGANRAGPGNAAAAASAPPKPPAAVVARPVVAKVAPPPPPVAFAQKQQALQANQGKPLDAKAEQNLRAATPPPAARFVKTAPPAAAVKPVETAPKKAQPATSLNTAQQAHPPAPGAPPVAAGSPQNAQQQLAAEKAKQQAAQQQAQQAAAEKVKQDAAQLHATQQQAAADKAKQEAAQQQAAAEKAKQDAAQQHMTQQQAAADKAKQEAAQQQAAQQAATEKAKQDAAQQHATQQQAAAEKAKQEAAQRQAAQQAATDKAKQEAAQQQLAAEKARQEAAQQHAAQQQAATEKVKQEAAQQAAAEKAKQEAAQQRAAQQQAASDKAKQEAAQQQAAQQAAAEKSRQQAAQQLAVAEKTKQDAAQRQAAQQPQATRPGPPSAAHPNETPAPPRAVVPPSANAELDRKHQQEQDQLRAKQEQDRLRIQQQQEQEHAKLAQQPPDAAKKQLVEQQHQQQTQQLLQKHADEQKALADKQKQERQNQAKPQKGDRPPQ